MKIATNLTILVSTVFLLASTLQTPVFAAITLNPTRAAIREERQAVRTDLKKDRAYQEIDRRIASLNNLVTLINGIKRLSSDQKLGFISQIQTEIANLQALRTKIQNDTDVATLTTDKQSIVKSYRVYALFMPKIRIVAHADRIIAVADEMKAATTNAETLSKIADAQTQAQNAINAVLPLTPDGYPGNKSTLESARGMLQTALQDLKTARQSMK